MLVGREEELALVQELLTQNRPVVVVGEAGAGKTTLLRAAAADSGRRVLEGGGLATLSWVPYLPIVRALGAELPAGDPAYVAGEIERRIDRGVLLLDDLHCADAETRRVLPFLVDRIGLLSAARIGDPGTPAVLAELSDLSFEIIEVKPLGHDCAASLLRSLRPDLSHPQVERIVARSGGNPLMLEEMAATGEASESLRLALAFRLRQVSETGRHAMGVLALAGRPLASDLVGVGADDLVHAGLVLLEDGLLTVRHDLVAETMIEQLDARERRELHTFLAQALDDEGEVARHYAAAGDLTRAVAKAIEAAEQAATPGERAAHLELAATCAQGNESDRLLAAAAEALAEVNLDARAAQLLDRMGSPDGDLRALRHLYRSRALTTSGDVEQAAAECEAGVALVAGTGSDVELQLAIEDAQLAQSGALLFEVDIAVARAKAARALELAIGSPRHEALARRLLGSIGLITQAPGWDTEFRTALALARSYGSFDDEFRAVSTFSFGLMISGMLDEASALYEDAVAKAQARNVAAWEWRLRNGLIGVQWHAGAFRLALDNGEALTAKRVEEDTTEFYVCQLLADVGRPDEAVAMGRSLVAAAHPTWQSLGNALWALADAQLAAGDARDALASSDEALERFGNEGPTAFLQVSRAWAHHDLNLTLEAPTVVAAQPIVQGAPLELQGIELLVAGENRKASERFHAASEAWHGRHFRGELRSIWAAGEALRRAGETAAAVERLEHAEQLAIAHDALTFLRRIRRSLRLSGVNRSAERTRSGSLTGREREVLWLVGTGLSNDVIARRLGIGRPTVARLVQSGSRKLGARSRMQAAVLAARE